MKEVKGEKIITVVRVHRKGRNETDRTEFELGVGYCLNDDNNPTGQIRIRTEQIDSGVAPIVATLESDEAEEFCIGLIDSISIANCEILP